MSQKKQINPKVKKAMLAAGWRKLGCGGEGEMWRSAGESGVDMPVVFDPDETSNQAERALHLDELKSIVLMLEIDTNTSHQHLLPGKPQRGCDCPCSQPQQKTP